ncbi:MAG: hypothetical protein ABIV28_00405, partial [Longimicrobiales bacterium]
LEDLHARTGLDIEMALASASRIRELIRAIYGDGAVRPGEAVITSLIDFVAEALDAGANRIGVSVRGAHANAWYASKDARVKAALLEGWDTALEDILDPSPFEAATRSRGVMQKFDATLNRGATDVAVEVQVLSTASGSEFLLSPTRPSVTRQRATVAIPPSVAAELRLLARSGAAHVALPGGNDPFIRDLVPQMPGLVFGETVRAAHLTNREDVPGMYTLRVTDSSDDILAAIESYEFDALSIAMAINDSRLPRILNAAPIVFINLYNAEDRFALGDPGINWLLYVTHDEEDALAWELRPVSR